MTADVTPVDTVEAPPPKARGASTVSVLALRWVLLSVVTLIAFHRSVLSMIDSTVEGSLNGFVWLIPFAAAIAAVGVARRDRVELPIHDRQTDVIVGIIGLGFALMLQTVLLQRYSQYFELLRIDLIAMWFFVGSSSVILFGLRPVMRFFWVWLMATMMFPLGYQLAVVFFGGNRVSAGVASLVIAAAATAISVGRTASRALVGAAATMLFGMTVLAALSVFAPGAPLLAFQMLPAMLATSVVGLGLYGYARRGLPKRWLDRKLEPVAAGQVWASIPLVLAAAAWISLVPLPTPPGMPTWVQTLEAGLRFDAPLAAPAGWHQTELTDYPWVRRMYGRDADLVRQRFVADAGNPEWDKFARPRTVIVDSTTTERPFSFRVYPATVLYDESGSRISDPRPVELGHGITGSIVTVVDDRRLLTFNLLTWTWRNPVAAQRIMVATVDNHEDNAVFPEPHGGLGATLRTMFGVFFRGNQATWDSDPTFKDLDLLTSFGQGLIDAQLARAENSPGAP